ncbi:MAG: dihydrolipoyl dehydrogenase [Chlamydiales bacterium]|nr:dihydrolipoyl dehydrogenase [Chlamydiales bacterium]
MEKFDLVVIGSGPGGYVAAIRAAQRGLKTACIEKEKTLGGTCLNVGCIPSKALLHSTEYYHKVASEGSEHGINAKELTIDLGRMMERKEKIVSGLVGGVNLLFERNKVVRIQGEASLDSPTRVRVGDSLYEADHILLATGSEPIPLPFLPFDEKRVLSSTGALSLPNVPKKLLMVGAGVIGLELGSVYQRIGAQVEVVELLDRVTPPFDREVSKTLYKIFSKQGMAFHLKEKVVEASVGEEGVELTLESSKRLRGDVVLVAIGRRSYSKGLGLEKIGVQTDPQGRVKVDGSFRSSVPSIYAIGDLIDGPMLAHKASEEGIAAVDLICGDVVEINYLAIPNVMYTWPEVACVGMTEEEAKGAGLEIRIGKTPFKAIPRARCSGDIEGMVKIIGEKESDRLIGMHIVGPNASEMIHEGVVAIGRGVTLLEIAHASHAHPTCSEAIKEAALAAHNQAIHA